MRILIVCTTKQQSVVTEIFITVVKPEMQTAYLDWAHKIQNIEAKFPGYQSAYTIYQK